MIDHDFRVNRTVGEGHSRAPDVARVRKALKKTGHSRPAPQPSGIYDRSIQDAVIRFQHDFGLREDGIVRPGGPTQTAINIAHAALEAGGRDGYEAVRQPFAVLHRAGLRYERTDESGRAASGRWINSEGSPAAPGHIQGLLNKVERPGAQLAMYPDRDPVTGQRRFPGQRGGILEGGGAAGGGRGTLPAGQLFKALFRHLFGESAKISGETDKPLDKPAPSGRTAAPDNPPSQILPSPAEPPPEPRKGKDRLEPDDRRSFVLPGPKPEEVRPGVLVFPDLSDDFNRPEMVEAHKGDEETRKELEELRDWLLELNGKNGWEHYKGGREADPAEGKDPELKELYIPGPHKDFDKDADGRVGSKFPDLTFRNKYTGELVHVQSVDTDAHGNPTKRELDNAEAIRKRTGDQVYTFRKRKRVRKQKGK